MFPTKFHPRPFQLLHPGGACSAFAAATFDVPEAIWPREQFPVDARANELVLCASEESGVLACSWVRDLRRWGSCVAYGDDVLSLLCWE